MTRNILMIFVLGTTACSFAHTHGASAIPPAAAPTAQQAPQPIDPPTSLVFGYGPGWQLAHQQIIPGVAAPVAPARHAPRRGK